MLEFLVTPLPPYAYTLIGIGMVTLFALRGYIRGFFKEIFSVLSLVLIIVLAKPFGNVAQSLLPLQDLPEMLHPIIAMTVGSIGGYVLIRFFFFLIALKFKLYRKWEGKAKLYVKLGGTIIGLTFGTILLMILSWYMLIVGGLATSIIKTPDMVSGMQRLIFMPTEMMGIHLAGFKESALGKFAEKTNPVPQTITKGVDIISDITQNPEALLNLAEYEPIADLMESESIQNLVENEEIKKMAEQGDIMGLLSHPDVQQLMEDPEIQETLKDINPAEIIELLGDDEETEGLLEEVMQNSEQYEGLIDDETVSSLMEKESAQKISEDPEIQRLIDEGNTAELLSNPDVMEFLSDPEVIEAMQSMSPEEVMQMLP
jgi:hypothetical protein